MAYGIVFSLWDVIDNQLLLTIYPTMRIGFLSLLDLKSAVSRRQIENINRGTNGIVGSVLRPKEGPKRPTKYFTEPWSWKHEYIHYAELAVWIMYSKLLSFGAALDTNTDSRRSYVQFAALCPLGAEQTLTSAPSFLALLNIQLSSLLQM